MSSVGSRRPKARETEAWAECEAGDGHYNYFGVNGNVDTLARLHFAVERAWRKWLDRRSQRARMTSERFKQLLAKHPLPKPEVRVRIWARP